MRDAEGNRGRGMGKYLAGESTKKGEGERNDKERRGLVLR